MLRSYLRKSAILCGLLPIDIFSHDTLSKSTKTEQSVDVTVHETGTDRLYRMFSIDEFGDLSPELHSVVQVASMSLFVGAVYGGVMSSRIAYLDFMENNQAEMYRSHIDAKKKLQDKVTVSFGKGAFKWGWRLSLFSTTFVGISTTVAAYRGKTGFLEYTLAGFMAGGLYKFSMGPRGWIVGSSLGLVLGTIAGCATQALLSVAGTSMDEVRYWQYHWKDTRDKYFHESVKNYVEEKQLQILTDHDKAVGPAGQTLDNLEAKK